MHDRHKRTESDRAKIESESRISAKSAIILQLSTNEIKKKRKIKHDYWSVFCRFWKKRTDQWMTK